MKILISLLIAAASLCLIKPSYSQDKLNVDYDYAYFRNEKPGKVYLELYYSFDQKQLLYVKSSKGYDATGRLTVDLLNTSSGKPVVSKMFKVPFSVADTTNYDKNKKLVGQITMIVDTGAYKLTIQGTDFNDTSYVVSRSEDIVIHGFPDGSVCESSLELATGIVKSSDLESIFYKNTLEVTPNPSLLYGNNLNSLFYYIEIYNMKKEQMGDKYSLILSIIDSKGNQDYTETKSYNVSAASKVEIGTVDISKFTTDKYDFSIIIKKENGDQLTQSTKTFYVFNPKVKDNEPTLTGEGDFLLSEFAKYTDKMLTYDYERMIYIMSDIQEQQYEKLKELDAKRLYMYNFWKNFKPGSTDASKAHKEYFARIDFANKNFAIDFREGWKSDRGRVFAIYGPYDDIDRHNYESDKRAYEIWSYNNIQGGAIFVFIDLSSGSGNWTLVHSTAQNEVRDDSWQSRLDYHK